MDKAVNYRVLGRNIGTATGWDMCDDFEICLYNFTPVDGLRAFLPTGDIWINFQHGTIMRYESENGTLIHSEDLIPILAMVPAQPEVRTITKST